MTKKEFDIEFNKMLGKVMTLIEVSDNYALKREVKGALFDFSDSIRERAIKEKEKNHEDKKQSNNL